MDVLLRIFVGVAAAWIMPDPLPQQGHASGYEERCTASAAACAWCADIFGARGALSIMVGPPGFEPGTRRL